MLTNSTQKIFFSIANGKIRHRDKDGNIQSYDTIEGFLVGVGRRQRDIGGRPTNVIDLEIVDGAENYCVSIIADSGVARSILCSLYGITDFKTRKVKIVTRLKVVNGKEYTNVYVYSGGEQAKWAIKLPEPESFKLPTGETHISYKKRDDVLSKCIDDINARINGGVAPEGPEDEQDLDPSPSGGVDEMNFLSGDDGDLPPSY